MRSRQRPCKAHAALCIGLFLILPIFFSTAALSHAGEIYTAGKSLEEIKAYLSDGGKIDAADSMGRTFLWHAALYGKLEIVRFLASKGADIDKANDRGMTPLMAALYENIKTKYQVVEFLVSEGADVNIKDRDGCNSLCYAVKSYGNIFPPDKIKKARLLLSKGAEISEQAVAEAAKYATISKSEKRYQLFLLLTFCGAHINVKNNNVGSMYTEALHYAPEEVIWRLIKNGADIDYTHPDVSKYRSWRPLHFAARHGHMKVLSLLIQMGADISARDSRGLTPLMLAAWNGHLEAARILIEKGAEINAVDNSLRSPLMFASAKNHAEVVRFLISKGASVGMKDKDGWTALMHAVDESAIDAVEVLVASGADVNERLPTGATLLMLASGGGKRSDEGNSAMVASLLGKGADVHATDAARNTALAYSLENNREDIVEVLLLQGARVKPDDTHAMRMLKTALKSGYERVAELLIASGLDLAGDKGGDILMTASRRSNVEMVKAILSRGANVNYHTRYIKETPLMVASDSGNEKMVKLLISKGADVNARDHTGRTALSRAASRGYKKIMKALISRGADRTDGDGISAELYYRAFQKEFDAKKAALLTDLDALDEKGETKLMKASESGDTEAVMILIKGGADVNARGEGDLTALRPAVWKGHLGIVKLLVEEGADVNAASHNGTTALMSAASNGHLGIVKFLVEEGADVNAATHDGATALMYAAEKGHLGIVKLLVEEGAGVNASTHDGHTALMFAVLGDNTEAAKYLISRGADVNAKYKEIAGYDNGKPIETINKTVLDFAKSPHMRHILKGYGAIEGEGNRKPAYRRMKRSWQYQNLGLEEANCHLR